MQPSARGRSRTKANWDCVMRDVSEQGLSHMQGPQFGGEPSVGSRVGECSVYLSNGHNLRRRQQQRITLEAVWEHKLGC